MRAKPVLPQVDALPCAEREASHRQWNRKLDRGQRRADVGWHVIGALVTMAEQRVPIRYQSSEEAFEVFTHLRIGILLHEQARGRVTYEKREQPVFHVACGCPIGDGARDLDEAAALGVEAERRSRLAEHRHSIDQRGRPREIQSSTTAIVFVGDSYTFGRVAPIIA